MKFIKLISLLSLLIVFNTHSTATANNIDEDLDIHIAMTAAFVSEEGVDIYHEISEYLSKKTGIRTHFVYGLSYSVINKMLESGDVDIAFICGYPYILSHDSAQSSEDSVKLLAAPIMNDPLYHSTPVYYSYVIVSKGSDAKSFEDLRGKRFVYNDEISNSGYNIPRAKLIEIGETNGFFSEILRSGSHEESIRMVSQGKADASAVDSLVLDYELKSGNKLANQIKVIETLGPSGIPPVVYSSKTNIDMVEKIRESLLNMSEDPEGKKILDKAFLKEFVSVDDNNYDDIRKMHNLAKNKGFMDIK